MEGGEPVELPFADIKPRRYEIMIPGPWSHWAELAFEKYYMRR
jgi:hypothetical protein